MVGRLWLGGVPGNYKPSSWRVGARKEELRGMRLCSEKAVWMCERSRVRSQCLYDVPCNVD